MTVAQSQASKQYVLLPTPKHATDAEPASASRGGRLLDVQSREEREQVAYEIGGQTVVAGVTEYWIGLSSNAAGAWAWDRDGGGLEPLPWGVGQPTSGAFARQAYVLLAAGAVDSELARAQTNTGDTHYPVCEIP